MGNQLLVTITAGLAYLTGAVGSYLHIRYRPGWAPALVRVCTILGLCINLGYLSRSLWLVGVVATFQSNFDAALLLAFLLGLVGLGTHLAPTMRGLDGLLLLAAAGVEFSELVVIRQPAVETTGRPWFISHSLAFAGSAAFFIAGGAAGIAYLLVNRMLRRKRLGLVTKVPPLEALERYGRWMPIIGFPLFTFGILTGLCGVQHRRDIAALAWYWDPTFVFSVLAWLVYAYLSWSLMYRPAVRGKRAATLATYGLGLVVVAFLAREFLGPLHR
ncbi:MAG: cytochrome c biogenesis protein CcsA [Phycisphaerae bacterium]|jgi:ABC-type uncharacterized transport system permease subunit